MNISKEQFTIVKTMRESGLSWRDITKNLKRDGYRSTTGMMLTPNRVQSFYNNNRKHVNDENTNKDKDDSVSVMGVLDTLWNGLPLHRKVSVIEVMLGK